MKKSVSYRLDKSTLEKLKKLAEKESRSLTRQLEHIIKKEYEKIFEKGK